MIKYCIVFIGGAQRGECDSCQAFQIFHQLVQGFVWFQSPLLQLFHRVAEGSPPKVCPELLNHLRVQVNFVPEQISIRLVLFKQQHALPQHYFQQLQSETRRRQRSFLSGRGIF
nr:unnamed protein product [Spirometra erinaceieuropaei]